MRGASTVAVAVAPAAGPGRRLRAVRVSRSVRDRLAAGSRAVVVGVYSRAAHLRLESGPLLVLVAPAVALSPNGIAIEVAPDRTMTDAGLRVGQTVELSANDPGAPGADWRVVLGGAPTWEPQPHIQRIAERELDGRLRITRGAVLADGARASFLPLLWVSAGGAAALLTGAARSAWVPARRLGEAAVRGDAGSVAASAHCLAGLGPGLTPSGDDLLSGFGAAWTLVGRSVGLGAARRRRVTDALVAGARAGASPLGRAWLGHAVRGELAEPMRRLVEGLFAAESRDLAPAARGVLAVGASSGTDWMVGFLLGAAAVVEAARRVASSC